MVFILNGNSDKGADEWSDLGYLICLDWEQSQIWFFFSARSPFLHTCAIRSGLQFYISTGAIDISADFVTQLGWIENIPSLLKYYVFIESTGRAKWVAWLRIFNS